jgi:hypothetical protein
MSFRSIQKKSKECNFQVLQLEVSNDHQGSDKFDLGMHFHHRTLVLRSRCAGGNSHEKQVGRTGDCSSTTPASRSRKRTKSGWGDHAVRLKNRGVAEHAIEKVHVSALDCKESFMLFRSRTEILFIIMLKCRFEEDRHT